MSLFGNRIFANIISISKVPIDLCGVGCVTTIVTVLIRSGKFGQSREDHVKMEAEIGVIYFKSRNIRISGNQQNLGRNKG